MKQFCAKHKMKLLIFLAVWSFSLAVKFFLPFGKPDGMDGKYPLFFLTISLVALYVFPMILIIRYIAKRFDISKKLSISVGFWV